MRSARAKRVVRSKRMSEQCERTSERTSEWPSTSVCIFRYSGPQCPHWFLPTLISKIICHSFLDAPSHLYKRVCPSVCPSVLWFIGMLVCWSICSFVLSYVNNSRDKKFQQTLRNDAKTGLDQKGPFFRKTGRNFIRPVERLQFRGISGCFLDHRDLLWRQHR